ncbi:hypothetical protein AB0I10_27640 [Streptomyces sp. NPDC050636]|uniref:hypothetical protein n=1 Tax=Streptomyces sp. NPDC050636 TaxID=3154510 RepID=UPI00344473E2
MLRRVHRRRNAHLRDLAGTHALLDAAERLCAFARPSRRMSATIAITRSMASALHGDAEATARQIDAAFAVHTGTRHDDDPDCTEWLATEALFFQAG